MLVWQNATLVVNGYSITYGALPEGMLFDHGYVISKRGAETHYAVLFDSAVRYAQTH